MKKFLPEGVCSQAICFDLDGKVIKDIHFEEGCPGNAIGIASLVKGQTIDKVIKTLKGIKCGERDTSCPDQLAIALEKHLAGQ